MGEEVRKQPRPAFILCGTDKPQPGTEPYFIGYVDMVEGYRHAWTETDRFGKSKVRVGRSWNHPADPRCPECRARVTAVPTKGSSDE